MASETEPRRLTEAEVLILPVTKEDLPALARGYYASFEEDRWHSKYEPVAGRPEEAVRVARFAKRLEPWLLLPHLYLRKAVLASDPSVVIGHAGWDAPGQKPHEIMNVWRKDASEKFGFLELMGWTKEEEDEIWEAFDINAWQETITKYDSMREEVMGDEPHWFLAPLWVMPEYQKRGVASLLLKDVIKLADAQDPPTAMYLEASARGKPVYERFGWVTVPVQGKDISMLRRGPKGAQ